jgi:glycosyltransferase involved in cell wall biosynthesis
MADTLLYPKNYVHTPLRVLVLVLTSGNLPLLRRAVSSVTTWQLPEPRIAARVRIVVNTLNDAYAAEVAAAFPDHDVVRTESNGFPGKGHNSQLAEFRRSRADYDFAAFLDGDDAYYPPAFQLLFKAMDSGVDVGAIQCNDKVVSSWDADYEASVALELGFGLRTYADAEAHWWRQGPPQNPFTAPFTNLFTPARLLFLSAAALDAAVQIQYCERAELYDDFLAYVCMLDVWHKKLADVRFMSNSYLYLYSTLNLTNATSTYVRNQRAEAEEAVFRSVVRAEAFPELAAAWAADPRLAAAAPFMHLGRPCNYGLQQKRELAVTHFVSPALTAWWTLAAEHFAADRWADALPLYDRLRETPQYSEVTRLNAGVCFYHTGRIAQAIECWLSIPERKRSALVYKNLGYAFSLLRQAGGPYGAHYLRTSLAMDPAQPGVAAALAALGAQEQPSLGKSSEILSPPQ